MPSCARGRRASASDACPVPPTVPATCVPWPLLVSVLGTFSIQPDTPATPRSPTSLTFCTTFVPCGRSGCVASTPESSTAMVTSLPVSRSRSWTLWPLVTSPAP